MTTAYKTVYDLNEEELLELKCAYYDILQYTDDADTFLCPDAIPDSIIREHYEGICFVDEDFFCNIEDDNYEGCGAAYKGI